MCCYHFKELRVGALLGKGGFCDVFEIGEVRLNNFCGPKQKLNVFNTSSNETLEESNEREFKWTREMMAKNYIRKGSARFAIKVGPLDDLFKLFSSNIHDFFPLFGERL